VSFDDLLIHTLVIYHLAPAMSGGAETVGGANTTLTADTAIGATSVVVALATGIAAGNFLRVGDAAEREVAQVGPGYTTGLTIPLVAPLSLPHDSGDQVRELNDAGSIVLDEYGQATSAPAVLATVAGLVQARSAREVALVGQGGAAIGSHVGYLYAVTGLDTGCWIVPDDGVRYDLLSVPDAAGQGHHLELALQAVT